MALWVALASGDEGDGDGDERVGVSEMETGGSGTDGTSRTMPGFSGTQWKARKRLAARTTGVGGCGRWRERKVAPSATFPRLSKDIALALHSRDGLPTLQIEHERTIAGCF